MKDRRRRQQGQPTRYLGEVCLLWQVNMRFKVEMARDREAQNFQLPLQGVAHQLSVGPSTRPAAGMG